MTSARIPHPSRILERAHNDRCLVYAIALAEHPTRADLQVATLGVHTVVVGRHYTEGQLVAYLPAGARVPDPVAEELWVLGKLGGKQKNRVRARALAGVFSEGLVYGSQGMLWQPEWQVGDDVTQCLGVTWS